MKIVISGGTGFIGSKLVEKLCTRGDSCFVLTRSERQSTENLTYIRWSGHPNDTSWHAIVDGADAVINLAGASVSGPRWTKQRKKLLRSSRVESTQAIVTAIQNAHSKPSVFINASAMGYYGSRKSEVLTEKSKPGTDFLSEFAINWENSATKVSSKSLRVVLLRTGLVLGKSGGALPKMLPPFRLGLGGELGNGEQWVSWIHIEDEVGLILHALDNNSVTGAMNLNAPNPVTNNQFSKELAKTLSRPCIFSIPEFVLKLAMGEQSTILLNSTRMRPELAISSGYKFQYPNLADAFRDCVS